LAKNFNFIISKKLSGIVDFLAIPDNLFQNEKTIFT
jgi:hypothetical protein